MGRILFLDDDETRHKTFMKHYGADHTVIKCYDAASVIASLRFLDLFDSWSLDHDLGGQCYVNTDVENSGSGVCRWIAANLDKSLFPDQVVIHSWNPAGADNMRRILREVGIEPIMQPFRSA